MPSQRAVTEIHEIYGKNTQVHASQNAHNNRPISCVYMHAFDIYFQFNHLLYTHRLCCEYLETYQVV